MCTRWVGLVFVHLCNERALDEEEGRVTREEGGDGEGHGQRRRLVVHNVGEVQGLHSHAGPTAKRSRRSTIGAVISCCGTWRGRSRAVPLWPLLTVGDEASWRAGPSCSQRVDVHSPTRESFGSWTRWSDPWDLHSEPKKNATFRGLFQNPKTTYPPMPTNSPAPTNSKYT